MLKNIKKLRIFIYLFIYLLSACQDVCGGQLLQVSSLLSPCGCSGVEVRPLGLIFYAFTDPGLYFGNLFQILLM